MPICIWQSTRRIFRILVITRHQLNWALEVSNCWEQLALFINDLTKGVQRGQIKAREAYLKLTSKCSPPQHVDLRSSAQRPTTDTQIKFNESLQAVLKGANDPKDLEKQFVFLHTNAQSIIEDEKLKAIVKAVYSEKMEIAEGNWLIAVALYEQYRGMRGGLIFGNRRKQILEGILVGYLGNRFSDFMEYRQEVGKKTAPFSVNDYLFYQMTHTALQQVSTSGAPDYGPFKDSLWSDFVTMKERHRSIENKPVPVSAMFPMESAYGRAYHPKKVRLMSVPLFPAPEYDAYLKEHTDTFLKELNHRFRKHKDQKNNDDLRKFVRDLNLLDLKARRLQAKLVGLRQLQAKPELQNHFAQSLKEEVEILRAEISQNIPLLKTEAARLLGEGKPSSLAQKIIGLGLLVISGIVAILCVVSLLLLPPAALIGTVAGVAFTCKVAASAGLACSGVGIGVGTFNFFRSLERKPAAIATSAGNMISFIEKSGIEACNEIRDCEAEHQLKGVSLLSK